MDMVLLGNFKLINCLIAETQKSNAKKAYRHVIFNKPTRQKYLLELRLPNFISLLKNTY